MEQIVRIVVEVARDDDVEHRVPDPNQERHWTTEDQGGLDDEPQDLLLVPEFLVGVPNSLDHLEPVQHDLPDEVPECHERVDYHHNHKGLDHHGLQRVRAIGQRACVVKLKLVLLSWLVEYRRLNEEDLRIIMAKVPR